MSKLARPERFELPTPRFVVWCSIQLSYGRLASRGKFHRLPMPFAARAIAIALRPYWQDRAVMAGARDDGMI